jgi:NADPH-dependent curcumin reductase CurA
MTCAFKLNSAMRGWLNDVRSYVPPVAIGDKMRGSTLATVMYSRIPGIKAGDTVIADVISPFPAIFGNVINRMAERWMV